MKRGVGEMGLGRRGGEGRAYLVDKLEYHLQANGCLQGRLWIFDNLKSSRWLHFLVEFNNTSSWHSGWWSVPFRLLLRNSVKAKVNFFIITSFQTNIRGEQGHPTGNMTSLMASLSVLYG